MTSTPRILALAAAAALALTLSACATSPTTDSSGASAGACDTADGVTLVVDATALGETSQSWCVSADKEIGAASVLAAAGVKTEGTTQYGDQVVCRVDGLPSASDPIESTEDPAYVEKCEGMPAAFAYWSLWVKPAGGAWDYAQNGLTTQMIEPGDSVELLFTLDGAPVAPAA